MLNRFNCGTVVGFTAGEDIKNNDIYILDPSTRKIRKAKDCDEWITCQLVYVNNISFDNNINFTIKKGTKCRCWISYLVL